MNRLRKLHSDLYRELDRPVLGQFTEMDFCGVAFLVGVLLTMVVLS